MNNIQFHERYDDNCHGIVWITYTRRIMSKVWQISFFQSFVFRVLRMPLPETTLETLVRYLWTHLWVPFCPVVPTRFHRAFGRGVLWASSDSSWVCWAWLSYYILHLKPLGGSWVGKRFLKRTCKKKPCHFLWFWYLYLSQVLSWICLPKPMARSTEESTDRSSPIPRIHQRQSLDPWRSFFVMSPNELLNNSTSSTRTRMIQEDPGNHKWPLGLFGRAYRVKSNIVSRGLTFYVQCLVTSIYRVYILNCCIFVYMPRSKSPFQNATVCTILSWVLQMAWSPLQSGLCQYCGTLGPGEKHRGSCYLWGRAVCRRAVTWMKCDEMLDIWRWIWEIDSDRFVQCNIL